MLWHSTLLYCIAIAFVTWTLTQMELASPGSLKLHLVLNDTDRFDISEYSPIEIIQAIILVVCSVIMAWVAQNRITQQPMASSSVAWR